MPQLFPAEIMQLTTMGYLPKIKVRSQIIYLLTLLGVLGTIVALPFVRVDVNVSTSGQIRPAGEKNELKALVSGSISKISVHDGQLVSKGQLLLVLYQNIQSSKLSENNYERKNNTLFIHDLRLLTSLKQNNFFSAQLLFSPLYKQQYIHYKYASLEESATLAKVTAAYQVNKILFDQKVISFKKFSDIRFEYFKTVAGSRALAELQLAAWQQDYSNYKSLNHKLAEEDTQLKSEMSLSEIKAPVSGHLQQFSGKYTGGHVQAGDLVGVISPDSTMIAECYLSPKDIVSLASA